MKHIVKNEGRYPIIVAVREGNYVKHYPVQPAESLTGEIIKIVHGDLSARYTVKPVDEQLTGEPK